MKPREAIEAREKSKLGEIPKPVEVTKAEEKSQNPRKSWKL